MRVPKWGIPLIVAAAAFFGLAGARLLAAPSWTAAFADPSPDARTETVRFVVQGVRCVDTARTMTRQLEGVPGALRSAVYASRSEALVTFDPALCSPEALRRAIEGPVVDETTGEISFQVFRVLSIDGNETLPAIQQ